MHLICSFLLTDELVLTSARSGLGFFVSFVQIIALSNWLRMEPEGLPGTVHFFLPATDLFKIDVCRILPCVLILT